MCRRLERTQSRTMSCKIVSAMSTHANTTNDADATPQRPSYPLTSLQEMYCVRPRRRIQRGRSESLLRRSTRDRHATYRTTARCRAVTLPSHERTTTHARHLPERVQAPRNVLHGQWASRAAATEGARLCSDGWTVVNRAIGRCRMRTRKARSHSPQCGGCSSQQTAPREWQRAERMMSSRRPESLRQSSSVQVADTRPRQHRRTPLIPDDSATRPINCESRSAPDLDAGADFAAMFT